jgi:hypothetical protein
MSFETGKLAKQTSGSVVVSSGHEHHGVAAGNYYGTTGLFCQFTGLKGHGTSADLGFYLFIHANSFAFSCPDVFGASFLHNPADRGFLQLCLFLSALLTFN